MRSNDGEEGCSSDNHGLTSHDSKNNYDLSVDACYYGTFLWKKCDTEDGSNDTVPYNATYQHTVHMVPYNVTNERESVHVRLANQSCVNDGT